MHTSKIQPLESLDGARFDTPAILKKLAESSRLLAELKGVAATIPNQGIVISRTCKIQPVFPLRIQKRAGRLFFDFWLPQNEIVRNSLGVTR